MFILISLEGVASRNEISSQIHQMASFCVLVQESVSSSFPTYGESDGHVYDGVWYILNDETSSLMAQERQIGLLLGE